MDNYFLIHEWAANDMSYALYTKVELQRIYRTFGNPSDKSTERLLRRSFEGKIDDQARTEIWSIAEKYQTWKTNAVPLRRFKLTVQIERLCLYHTVKSYTMFLNHRRVLHIVDISTHFCAESFIHLQTSMEGNPKFVDLGVYRSTGLPPSWSRIKLHLSRNESQLGVFRCDVEGSRDREAEMHRHCRMLPRSAPSCVRED